MNGEDGGREKMGGKKEIGIGQSLARENTSPKQPSTENKEAQYEAREVGRQIQLY